MIKQIERHAGAIVETVAWNDTPEQKVKAVLSYLEMFREEVREQAIHEVCSLMGVHPAGVSEELRRESPQSPQRRGGG